MPVTSTSEVAGLDAALAALTTQATLLAKAASQSISANTDTAVTFGTGTEVRDDGNWHDASVNNSRITVSSAGLYLCVANVDWGGIATGNRFAHIRFNGATYAASASGTGLSDIRQSVATVQVLATSDYVEIDVFTTVATPIDAASLAVLKLG